MVLDEKIVERIANMELGDLVWVLPQLSPLWECKSVNDISECSISRKLQKLLVDEGIDFIPIHYKGYKWKSETIEKFKNELVTLIIECVKEVREFGVGAEFETLCACFGAPKTIFEINYGGSCLRVEKIPIVEYYYLTQDDVVLRTLKSI